MIGSDLVWHVMHQSFETPLPPLPFWEYPGHSLLLSVKCSESPALQGKFLRERLLTKQAKFIKQILIFR